MIAIGIFVIFTIGRRIVPIAAARPFLVLPAAGIAIAALAILFAQTTGHSIDQVLFSGQEEHLAARLQRGHVLDRGAARR